MARSKTISAWAPKNKKLWELIDWIEHVDEKVSLNSVFKKKGRIADWAPSNWPPKKIEITIKEKSNGKK